jgi:nucleotide sugar dehydrogenase
VGTARRIAGELSWACPRAELAWNPEFLREGSAVADTLSPDRIVAGVTSGDAEKILRQVYARPLSSGTPLIVTSLETAELAKVAANAFLATKISFINAMAEVCETAGGDVRALAEILGAACRRTSARSWPAPRNWAQGPRSPSCARWTPSTCGAVPAPLTSPSKWLAAT